MKCLQSLKHPDWFSLFSKMYSCFFLCVSSDAEPPGIQCPDNIVAETDERRGTANVSWNVPIATDNSKEEVGYFTKCSDATVNFFPIKDFSVFMFH